ncbi:MAG: Protein translocase subunit SecY [Mycoplasmataceae bacterium]|nr:MAG: Protein translocase subunit SecY [Mycoplasmataceae bacterium]
MQDNNSSKIKRIRLKYQNFFLSFFYTFFLLFIYFLGKYLIPFPGEYFLGKSSNGPINIFSSGINIHLQIGFFISNFFAFYNYLFNNDNQNGEKIKRIKLNVSKFLKSNIFSLYGLYYYWHDKNYSYYSMFITYLAFFASNCLLEIIMGLISDYGVCNGFNLVLFTETIPVNWLKNSFSLSTEENLSFFSLTNIKNILFSRKLFSLSVLFLLTLIFSWISNLKWEVPVETNNIYFNNNNLLDNNRFKFGFKMSFGLMNLIQLSWIINFIYHISSMFLSQEKKPFIDSFKNSSQNLNSFKTDSPIFYQSFLALNNEKSNFRDVFSKISNRNSKFYLSFPTYLIVSFLSNWMLIYNFQVKPKEISDDLRKRGIYFDGIPSGSYTEKLIRKVINKLILIWSIFVIVLNFFFDQIFFDEDFSSNNKFSKRNYPSFINWFNGVSIGIELFNQIKNKYEYIQSYD